MTLLELLEILVKKADLNNRQRADAEVLLKRLKAINAFGNAVNETIAEHECVPRWVDAVSMGWGSYYGGSRYIAGYYKCNICGRKLTDV